MGFYFGDGSFYVRFRHSLNGFHFIPHVRFSQKFIEALQKKKYIFFLLGPRGKAAPSFSYESEQPKPSPCPRRGVPENKLIFFPKGDQLSIMYKLLIFFDLESRLYLESQIAILKFIYSFSNDREESLDSILMYHW